MLIGLYLHQLSPSAQDGLFLFPLGLISFELEPELQLLRDTISLLVAYFLLPYSAQDIFSSTGFSGKTIVL